MIAGRGQWVVDFINLFTFAGADAKIMVPTKPPDASNQFEKTDSFKVTLKTYRVSTALFSCLDDA
jgi:hypothetical protein